MPALKKVPRGFNIPNQPPSPGAMSRRNLNPTDEANEAGIEFAKEMPEATTSELKAKANQYEDSETFKEAFWQTIHSQS